MNILANWRRNYQAAQAGAAQVAANAPHSVAVPNPSPQLWYVEGKPYTSLAQAESASDALQKATEATATPERLVPRIPPEPAPAPKQIVLPEAQSSAAQPAVQENPVSTTPAKPNGFVSFLKNIGKVLAKAIGVAGAVEDIPAVQAAETLAFGPAITGMIEKWDSMVVAVETTAATAVSTANSNASLTGAQKAAIVIAALSPEAQQVAQQLGASPLTQADLAVINNAVVAIRNVFQVPASA